MQKLLPAAGCFVAWLLLPFFGFAQVPYSYSLNRAFGFEANTVFNLHQDTRQRTWLAANDGLYCYTGSGFKKYENSGYTIGYTSIQEDSTGRIWCQNFSGQIFYVEGDSLKLFVDHNDYMVNGLDYLVAYWPEVYVGSDYGLYRYHFREPAEPEQLEYKPGEYNSDAYNMVSSLQPYRKGIVYINRTFSYYRPLNGRPELLADIPQTSMLETEPHVRVLNGTLWYSGNYIKGEDKSPFLFRQQADGALQPKALPFKKGLNMMEGSNHDDYIWMCTRNGLYIMNRQFELVVDQPLLQGRNITDVERDREGNYWVSTIQDGVFIIPSLQLRLLAAEQGMPQQLTTVIKDRYNRLFFVGRYGKIFRENNGALELIADLNTAVEAVHYDYHRHQLMFEGLTINYDLVKGQTVENRFGRAIKAASFLNDDEVLTSSSGSAAVRMPYTKNGLNNAVISNTQMPLKKENFKYSLLRTKRSYHNVIDSAGATAYVSYTDGLYRYRDTTELEVLLEGQPVVATALADAEVMGIWVATTREALLRLKGDSVVRQWSLPVDVHTIVPWQQYLFLASDQGIIKLDTATGEQNGINQLDGLPANEVADVAIRNNTLYAITAEGPAMLPCAYSYTNTTPPVVRITGVSIWERDTTLHPKYTLGSDQNNLTLTFSALALRSRGTYQYQYRMLGISENWINQNSDQPFVRFPSLPPGRYTFQVKALNEDGIASEPVSVNFFIDAPFYQKWWFYTLVGLAIVLLVSAFFLIRIRIIRRRNKLLLDREALKKMYSRSQLSALRAQMNPHFVFNALNSIQEYIVTNNKDKASNYLGLFADLMRKYLHYSQEDGISLEEELDTLKMYLQLEQIRFEETLTYKLEVDDELMTTDITLPVMLVQPLVENAIKHGLLHKKGDQRLTVRFKKQADNLLIEVEDNGIGRMRSAEINKMRKREHRSFATSALQKRIHLINQQSERPIRFQYIDLEENGQPQGTVAQLVIPL